MSSAKQQQQVASNEFVPASDPARFGFTGLNPRVENVNGMTITYDFELQMRDGVKLRADIYRPEKAAGPVPVLLNYTPYGKHQALRHYVFYPSNGGLDPSTHSTYCGFEGLDPIWWTRRGYIIAYVDSRGSFASDGEKHYFKEIDCFDVDDTVEELAKIDGSNGAVGMAGASALAMYQWTGAVQQPPSLKAIIPFDGMTDNLAEFYSHGGIPKNNFSRLYPSVFALGNHAGNLTQMPPPRSVLLACERIANFGNQSRLGEISWPVSRCHYMSFADTRTVACTRAEHYAATKKPPQNTRYKKWHWQLEEESLLRQKAFYEKFTKGREDTEVEVWPKVRIQMREDWNSGWWRQASAFPLKETVWTTLNLSQSGNMHEVPSPYERTVSFDGTTKEVLSWNWTVTHKTTFAGPAKLRLWVDPLTNDDLDIHVHLDKIDSEGNRILFAAHDMLKGGVARGWMRASRHIELITFSVVLRAGESLRLRIAGRDLYEVGLMEFAYGHENINKGLVGVHNGGKYDSQLLLPLIPDLVEHALTTQAIEKPVKWIMGAVRLDEADHVRFVSDYLHVHSDLTKKGVGYYPFGFKYQQLFTYPPAEINKVKSVIGFKCPTIDGEPLDAVTRLTYGNMNYVKNNLTTPEYLATARKHNFAKATSKTFAVVGAGQAEVIFKYTSQDLTDVAVYLFHKKEFTPEELKKRVGVITKLGIDAQLNVYRQTVRNIHTQRDVDWVFKGSLFEPLDFLSYKVVEEFIFDGVSSAAAFFALNSAALKEINPEAEAQVGHLQYCFDKLNNVEKVQRFEDRVKSLAL